MSSILPPDADGNKTSLPRCNNDGGVGIGAGHVCRCVREAGHPMTDYSGRAHGCSCGALWGDR